MPFPIKRFLFYGLLAMALFTAGTSFAQDLYTARGYWVEATKEVFRKIQQKQERGDSLSLNERTYFTDYSGYLATYYEKLSAAEKEKYQQMKAVWDRELVKRTGSDEYKAEEFEWRGRDRVLNMLYGIYYGTTIVVLGNIENAATVGIPLITGGLWMLGPAIMPKKYEGISESTMRASNSGKFLGLINGASLGLTIMGSVEGDEAKGKGIFALSAVGSIAMGEAAFQWQKKKHPSDGHIELMRHYGIVGPWVGLSTVLATQTTDGHLAGAALLAGSVSGLILGNSFAKKYDYTRGDVDVVSSRSWIFTGLALTAVIDALDNSEEVNAWILVPAAGTVLGSLLAQKSVKGLHFSKTQGSTINLVTGGASLIGLGIVAIIEPDSPAVAIGIPSLAALFAHQVMFHKYKMQNLELNLKGSRNKSRKFNMAMNFNPENYFVNKRIPAENFSPQTYTGLMNPVFKLKFTF